jgi:deoxyuridine 5'-triphosphate nucleotidohydrolase
VSEKVELAFEVEMGEGEKDGQLTIPVCLTNGAKLPKFATSGAAGFDIASVVDIEVPCSTIVGFKIIDDFEIECSFLDPQAYRVAVKRGSAIVHTGLHMAIPEELELEIRGRSGLSFNKDIEDFNGTIDSDFRGEIKIKIFNNSLSPFTINVGDRIAQGVIKRIKQCAFTPVEMDELSQTVRGIGGLGHTGK